MKIICESCRTKYSISDDKVRGKVIKLKCKKCQNMIVVKGTDGTAEGGIIEGGMDDAGGKHTMLTSSDPSMEAVDALDNEVAGRAAPRTMISGGAGGDWHLVLNEQQTGPFGADEVEQKFRSGEINAGTFIWKEGFSDWIPISSVPEFSHLASGAVPAGADNEATNLYNTNNPPKDPSNDPFGAAPSGNDDLFGSSKPAAAAAPADPFGQDDPFGNDAPQSGGGAKPPLPNMTGARSESSVLFSLTNLQALALGSKDAKASSQPQKAAPSTSANTEGSGLIDIRSMSSALQFSKEKEKSAPLNDALQFSGDSAAAFAPSIASGVMLPMEPKSNTGVIIGAIIGSVVALAGVVVLVLFLTGVIGGDKNANNNAQALAANTANNTVAANTVTPPANPETPAATPNTPPPVDPAVATPTPTPTATPAVDPKKDPKAADPKKDPKLAATDPKTATPKETTKVETAVKTDPTLTATPKEDPTKNANNNKNKDELDDLLGGKKDSGAATASGPETLSNAQISGVMSKANTGSCLAIGTGKVQMKVTISSSGSVTNAVGDGTPLGNCVAGIVRRLKFPAISSPSQTFPYPVYVK